MSKWTPDLIEFIDNQDYQGAITFIEFQNVNEASNKTLQWLAYACYHYEKYELAISTIDRLLENDRSANEPVYSPSVLTLLKCACLFFLKKYESAKELLESVENSLNKKILQLLVSSSLHEKNLESIEESLWKSSCGKLAIAARRFQMNDAQDALNIYKSLLEESPEDIALNYYIALCYYRLDYYEMALESVGVYLAAFPKSPSAINLRACINSKLYRDRGDMDVKLLLDTPLYTDTTTPTSSLPSNAVTLRNNVVVFRDGADAIRRLLPLVQRLDESRLNLVISHLRTALSSTAFSGPFSAVPPQGSPGTSSNAALTAALSATPLGKALELMEGFQDSLPSHSLVRATVHTAVGYALLNLGDEGGDSRVGGDAIESAFDEHIQKAMRLFHAVGSAPSECDTIPGRQAMSSYLFLKRQFDDVCLYLSSIKPYLSEDDAFNWNYGLALAATGKYEEALDRLQSIHSPECTGNPIYLQWLARCLICTGAGKDAWEIFHSARLATSSSASGNTSTSCSDVELSLLRIIASDGFRHGQFLYSLKAYCLLLKLGCRSGTSNEAFEAEHFRKGAIASAAAVIRDVVARLLPVDVLQDVREEILGIGAMDGANQIISVISELS